MHKIYSRPRIRIPKVLINGEVLNNHKNKKIAKIIIILIIAFSTVKIVLDAVYPIFDTLCEAKAKSIATIVSNEQATNVMKEHSYDELFTLINDIYNNDKVDIINFVDKLDNEGKEIIKFLQELLIFLKDVILYKNAKILSNIEIKNDYIIKTSELYSDNLLYDLIENLNDVQNVIKSSTHGSIIFMTFILKFSDAIYNNGDNSDNNTIKIDETVEKNKNSAGENNKKEKNISREIKKVGNIQKMSDDEINVRVNNALATASTGVLNNFKNNWSKIDDYLTDEKFSVVSGLLKDFVPVVASEKYVIVASDLISMVDRINDDIIDVEMFFRKLFDFNIFVVAITTDRWKDEKNKYVSNIKNGIKYYVKELNKSNVDETKNNNPVDELIDLLGDSVIEYK